MGWYQGSLRSVLFFVDSSGNEQLICFWSVGADMAVMKSCSLHWFGTLSKHITAYTLVHVTKGTELQIPSIWQVKG